MRVWKEVAERFQRQKKCNNNNDLQLFTVRVARCGIK